MTDTIYALATAPGRASVAIVRVSGPCAHESRRLIAERPFERAPLGVIPFGIPPGAPLKTPSPTHVLCKLINPVSRETIDRALVLSFESPASFTGEDVVEYQLHGGPAIVSSLLAVLSSQPGHRMAEPGEFTRRAFENGKMDLTAAEAVADLINAETQAQKAQALSQMEGSLSRLYDGWREDLSRALAYLEADIDFPDEDLPGGAMSQVRPALEAILSAIKEHLDDKNRGERLRSGIQVAVIGAPNAGKSSLVNALAKRDVVIVSAHAGTTRDVIEVHLDLGGYPVILADTAGLRPDQLRGTAQDSIESEGIRRALDRAKQADIRVLLFDMTQEEEDTHTLALQDDQSIKVFNKCDQSVAGNELAVSAKTGEGLDVLIETLTARIKDILGTRETPSLTQHRHREALEECLGSLLRAQTGTQAELVAEDVRLAMRALGRITGRVDVEDLLDVIFRDFCIGK